MLSPIAGNPDGSKNTPNEELRAMAEDKLREAAREEIEALPAETAAGNVDADSDGRGAAFGDEPASSGRTSVDNTHTDG
ncbi:MAG TPA: hypothetical protein VFH74_07145 [Gaiellales bacterium]|nr:hypothetical protein [Gaiellales bacterium]